MRRRVFWGVLAVSTVTLFVALVVVAAVQRSDARQDSEELFRQAGATVRLIEDEIDGRVAVLSSRGREILAVAGAIGGFDYVEVAALTARGVRSVTDTAVLIPRLTIEDTFDRAIFEVDVDGETVQVAVRRLDVSTENPVVIAFGRIGPPRSRVIGAPLFLALAIGVVLSTLFAGAVARYVGRRLDGLVAASAAVGTGDLSVRISEGPQDEISAVESAFNNMAADLAETQQRERDFLLSVGHDLRTPLTTIRGYAEALESGDIPTEDVPRVARVLGLQSDRLRRLVEDLMALSRLEAKQFSLRTEEVDIGAHLKGVAEGHRSRADEARVRLTVDISPMGSVITDPDRVAQVCSNLIDNALRYTPEGGAVVLTVGGGRDGGVEFSVADTGPGIDPADIPHIFERLYVAQRYRPVRPEGSGLGLTIVKELVRVLGGTVSVTSTPGEGTVLTVTLPPHIDDGAVHDHD